MDLYFVSILVIILIMLFIIILFRVTDPKSKALVLDITISKFSRINIKTTEKAFH